MPYPRVRAIPHPPVTPPSARVAAETTTTHSGIVNDDCRPPRTSARAMTPMLFWASLPPWAKASRPVPPTSMRRRGRLARRVARRSARRPMRNTRKPAAMPAIGERTSATTILVTPSSCPSARAESPQLTSPGPAATMVTPTRPPTSAWVNDEGIAKRQVTTFHTAAPAIPAATIASAVMGSSPDRVTTPPIVSATAVPARKGPMKTMTAKNARAPAGRIAPVTTPGVHISAASWKPLVTLKTTAARIVSTSMSVSMSAAYARGRGPPALAMGSTPIRSPPFTPAHATDHGSGTGHGDAAPTAARGTGTARRHPPRRA